MSRDHVQTRRGIILCVEHTILDTDHAVKNCEQPDTTITAMQTKAIIPLETLLTPLTPAKVQLLSSENEARARRIQTRPMRGGISVSLTLEGTCHSIPRSRRIRAPVGYQVRHSCSDRHIPFLFVLPG